MKVDGIDAALDVIRTGGIVVVVDDESRENEGDLVMAAQFATTETVAFFLEYTSGLLCTAVTEERAAQLDLPLMVEENTEKHGTAFLVSVDYRLGTSTGISAADRAATARALADETTDPRFLARPGHVLPLRARVGGVLKRAGHTEAGVDLCQLAGLAPAALLCEIVTSDRTGMMRPPDLTAFARRHGLPIISIASLVRHRQLADRMVTRTGEADIPTALGKFHALAYRATNDAVEHLALVMGDVRSGGDVLVRVHSECLTGDLVGSLRCDCGPQFDKALAMIGEAARGVLVYLRGHEGRGIGLGHKLRAYELQHRLGLDTVDANLQLGLPVDRRDYGIGAAILADLGVRRIQLLTNNPDKYQGLSGFGIELTGRIPLETSPTPENLSYLMTKQGRMGHLLDLSAQSVLTGAAAQVIGIPTPEAG
ncbi:MAG TPA: bifunctional 3,4-dihydroxy-2-butanone-4-phosphate synthase/GTP cyclohydrolase II [Acidimicrobiales bacterium]|jgi:3,4-dihydroxy 2-butanone 4-phosphate synthase/GTP cyclohydrolase II|nr:bifunctional 3,4-dihydroxy-2-butanone-4-phosphate synthase/GTP cyclohydrolase II [Acidimicrobiales bacterium]